MSLFTAVVPLNQHESLPPHHQENISDNDIYQDTQQDEESHYHDKTILFLGFMTGIMLETCDLGISMAAHLELWQQVLFSFGWSCMLTAIACITMVCIQCISNNTTTNPTFLFGTVTGLATAIACNQIIKGSLHFVAALVVSAVGMTIYKSDEGTSTQETRECETVKCENINIAIV